ncbi:hypothetical protein BOX15_Mlig027007g1, partial [Macrostomum lignano]
CNKIEFLPLTTNSHERFMDHFHPSWSVAKCRTALIAKGYELHALNRPAAAVIQILNTANLQLAAGSVP